MMVCWTIMIRLIPTLDFRHTIRPGFATAGMAGSIVTVRFVTGGVETQTQRKRKAIAYA